MISVLKALQGHSDLFPPIWLMRQAGRYLPEYRAIREKAGSFMDLCFHEDFATEVTLQPLKRFDLDAAILFSDILTIPHVLGQTVQIKESHGPVLESLGDTQFFEKAKDVDIKKALSTPLNVIRNVRKFLPRTKALIGFSGSPWTVATYMLEGGKSRTFDRIIKLLMINDPLFSKTMTTLEELIGTYLIAQIQAGADVVQIFDTWASAVPEKFQQRWIVAPIRRIIMKVHATYPDTPVIYYGRGVSALYKDIAKDCANIAFSVDENVSFATIKEQVQPIAPVQGNLCPQVLVAGGVVMEKKVKELLRVFHGMPYVFNLGHGIVPQTPVDHVAQLVDLVKEGHKCE
jgi:uroporphyrinogen decarboxylase